MDTGQLLSRTRLFALEVIRFFQKLPKTDESRIIGKQLIRSGTSMASNYRAACRSRSEQEFYSKLCIVVEEIDETLFWIELLKDSGISSGQSTTALKNEAEELLRIFSSSRKTVKSKLESKKMK